MDVGIGTNRGLYSWQCKISLFTTESGPALGPTQPPIQWESGTPSPGVKLTAHIHLVQNSRMLELYLQSSIRLHGIVLN
jgi:hypothetical protein